MVVILTDEQVKKLNEETDKFLLSLDQSVKSTIVRLLEPLIKQINCDHEFIDLDSYENNFPENCLLCKKCDLMKKKNGDRKE